MARYLAQSAGCVGKHYVRPGELFDYEGPAPRWAVLLPEPRKQVKQKAAAGQNPTAGKADL